MTKTAKPIPVIEDVRKSDDRKDMAKEEKARFEDDGGGQHNEPQSADSKDRDKVKRPQG
jgi:hypothetical protein